MADKQVRAQYTQEFKLEAVRQVQGGQSQLKVVLAQVCPSFCVNGSDLSARRYVLRTEW